MHFQVESLENGRKFVFRNKETIIKAALAIFDVKVVAER